MSKKPPKGPYESLLSASRPFDSSTSILHFEEIIFLHDKTQAAVSTDGKMALFDRPLYGELKVRSRLLDAANCLKYDPETKVFSQAPRDIPDLDSVIPSQAALNSEYRRIRLTIPEWVKGISTKEKKPYISFILGETPVLAIGDGYDNAMAFNLNFFKRFAGQTIDLYLEKTLDYKKAAMVFPEGQSLDAAPWFALIMPLRKDEKRIPKYV